MVLMPTVDHIGISRRIENEDERKRLKEITEEIKPSGMGLIVRTACEGRDGDDLVEDMNVLLKLWAKIQQKWTHACCSQCYSP